jgi:hypothetical protein
MPISIPMAQAFPRVRMVMSLINLDTPCNSSRAAPIGIVSFTGQYWMPHSVNETSPRSTASEANLQLVQNSVPAKMKKNTEVTISAMALPRGENLA